MDVIACGELNDEILWWENDGDENFTEHMVDSLINGIHTVIPRDVDLDGDMDILAAACIGSRVVWYENDGMQEFAKHDLGYCAGALWLDAADLDNDGDYDLFGAAMGASHLAWWENPGDQQFIKHNINSTFTQAFCVVPAMMDNDNDIDLLAIGWQSNKISWFENDLESPNLLNNPESVVYDLSNHRYLVSNWEDGNIISINESGQQQIFNDTLQHVAGLHIINDVLYACSYQGTLSGIVGFDLSTTDIVFHVQIPGMTLPNGITSDTSEYLYVTAYFADKIFKINISDSTSITLVDSGLTYPNGAEFDFANNRLLVMNEGMQGAPIIAVDINTGITSTLVETNISSTDGLTIDDKGNTYFSSWSTNKVYRYDETFTNPPEVVSSGHSEPADIFFNKLDNILAIPNFNSNSVDFIQLGFVIHVPGDQPTIQAGINVAQNGDTVLVAPGIYFENINFNGKNIVVASHYVLNSDLSFINSTIIDGSEAQHADTASCVRFDSNEDSTAVLQGFTIRQGSGTHWVDPQFPAYTWHSGGGIFIFQSSPTIKNNYIIDNHVDDNTGVSGASGGGICMYGGNPVIFNNIIKNNTALYGAGVVIDYSGCVFKNNIVAGNSGVQSYGGAGFWTIGNGEEDIIIENNTIVNNESSARGGAFYLWFTDLSIRGNILWGNTQSYGGQIYLKEGATIDITWSDVEGGYEGEGNIDAEPLFADTAFILTPDSPCVDAGYPYVIYNDLEDPDNPGFALWPSQGLIRNDIGAYGGPFAHVLQNMTTGLDKGYFPDQEEIKLEVFPNPFNSKTKISYSLPEKLQVKLLIFDTLGSEIATLINEEQNPGNYEVEFDAAGLISGIYYYQIIAGSFSQTKILILSK